MATFPEGEPAPKDGKLPDNSNLLTKPFSLYVHVPYCSKRCGYCDFNTYTPSELDREDQISSWLESAVSETHLAKKVLAEKLEINSIFFGGGTPSLLEGHIINDFLQNVKNNFELDAEIEITIEANPDTITDEKINEWLEAGINRVSIGMQSAAKNILKILDRTHQTENVKASVDLLQKNGLNNISLDLIYGTPGETLSDWEMTLNEAISLGTPHISTYSLVIEAGTKMGAQLSRGEIDQVNDDESADKYILADEILTRNNFVWYEISNWAKNENVSRHNLNYWQGNNWWGIGPGAHSHINGTRWWNQKLPNKWRESLQQGLSPALAREILTNDQKIIEKIMLELRLKSGINIDQIDSKKVEGLVKDQLALIESGRLVLTLQGRLLADVVFRELTS